MFINREKIIQVIIIIFLLFINYKLKAQPDTNIISKNVIFIEGAGIGGYGSLNYERLFPLKKEFKIGLRIGLSTYNITDFTTEINPDIIIPISLNGMYGNNHKIEFGFGQTISNIVQANYSNWKPERVTNFHSNFTFGYRYQQNKGGFIFRCSYTPIIEFNKYYRHWGSISIGYCF